MVALPATLPMQPHSRSRLDAVRVTAFATVCSESSVPHRVAIFHILRDAVHLMLMRCACKRISTLHDAQE